MQMHPTRRSSHTSAITLQSSSFQAASASATLDVTKISSMSYSDARTPSFVRRIISSLMQAKFRLHVQLKVASTLGRKTASTGVLHMVWPTAEVWPTPAHATQYLEPDDLAQLWILRISAQLPNVVQYPEVCMNGDVTVWRIRNFDADMTLPDDVRELLSPQHSQPVFPDTLIPTDTLKEKLSVSETSCRLHLIFVFRHSNPAGEGHVEEHFWDAMDTAASLSVSLAGDTIETMSTICVEKTRGRHIQLPCSQRMHSSS
jgi:hypothetical protein